MPQSSDYALLSADAYRDALQREVNYAPIPPGWVELTDYAVSGSGVSAASGSNGFSARVYKYGNESIVACINSPIGGGALDWIENLQIKKCIKT